MAGIFISYRRDDAQGEALHLFDNLKQHFGVDRVFMDVIAIRPGEDYRKVIDSAVASCEVLITLIGKEWLQSTTAAGQPRLNDARDFVRLETAAALKRDVRVIPVLVHGAAMPTEEVLPDELKPLAFRNAIEVSHSRWDYDVRMLIEALERVITPAAAGPVAPSTATVAPNTPGPTMPTPRERRPAWQMAVVAGVVACVLGGAGYWLWPETAPPPPPALSGKGDSTPSPEPPKTTPVGTKPAVNTGEAATATVEVPKVTGLMRVDASDRLKQMNLLSTSETVSNRQHAAGVVVAQNPEPGARVPAKTVITLSVAVSPDPQASGTCVPGYVWREAIAGDRVCVTPQTRVRTVFENKQADLRLEQNASRRPYGPDTCAQGYVWREATPSDHVCVTPEIRAHTAQDNAQAASRIAR